MNRCACCNQVPEDGVLVEASDDSQYPNAEVCMTCDERMVRAALEAMGITDFVKLADGF